MAGRRTAKQQVQMPAPEPMEEVSLKRPWSKVDADGKVIKRKKVPGAKNIRIRKYVTPRNALSCLNELVPGVVFNTEEGGVGQQYGVSVTLEDNTYHGYGPSKQIAKQNAAEAALVSFVKPPVPKTGPGEENEKMEDKTPWAALAAFAMYKLFNDWKEGRIGTQAQAGGAALPTNPSFDLRNHLTRKMNATAPSAEMNDAITAHLGTPAAAGAKVAEVGGKGNAPAAMKPAAKVPDNAASVHPVMVLHQMRPGIQYTTNKTTGDDNMPYFYASVNIDGQEFTGEGSSLKKAKFFLARDAIYALFGVESVFENPA